MMPASLRAWGPRTLDNESHAYDPIGPDPAIDAHEMMDMDM